MRHIIIATRASNLAKWQANYIGQSLVSLSRGKLSYSLLLVKTKGDKILDMPLAKIGGKGLFVKEIEEALINKQADMAVHSLKDMPAVLPQELEIAVITRRGQATDTFLSMHYPSFLHLPQGARLGTSSLRRKAQALHLRPDLSVIPLRGNVETRLKKLKDNEYDGIILASSGLSRLKVGAKYNQELPVSDFLPAVAQGSLGIEILSDRKDLKELLTPLNHLPTKFCTLAERSFLHCLEGSCQVPIAAYAELISTNSFANANTDRETDKDCLNCSLKRIEESSLDLSLIQQENDILKQNLTTFKMTLTGFIAKPDASLILKAEKSDFITNAEDLGQSLGQDLKERGADLILSEIKAQNE